MRFSNFLSGFEGTRLSDAHINISQTGCLFSCYELNMVDQESQEGVYQLEELKRLISRISPGDRLKFYLRSDVCHTGINTSRDKAIEQIGRIEYRPFLVFESQSVTFGSLVRKYSFGKKNWHPESKFRQKIESLELNGNSLVSKKLDLKAFVGQTFGSQLQSQLILQRGLLGTTLGVSAILRLNKFKSNPINLETLSALKDQLKPPFLVCLSLSPYSREYSEALLRSRIGRSSSLESLQDQTRMADSEQDLQSVISDGERLFAIEMQILFFDKSEDDLKRSLSKAEASLSTLGDFEREHFGLRSCLKSMLPGNPQHNSLIEKQTLIPFFVPIFSRGGSSPSNSKRSLAIHRRDDSIDSFDLFDSRYDNYSACIFGKSGSGKSVLTNLLTRALHNDSSVKIIKIDVGGSHSKETRSLGGTEYKLSLDQPSGLNPFREATLCENREAAIGVLVSFLSVLILETGEAEVSKTIRGELESVLSEYLSSNPLSPSISDFYKFSARIPRKSLLKRWTNQGVFKNAFQECSNVQVEERLRYYNFSEIFQASDPDFGQGGLAAVMAQFNFEMMKSEEKRIVFIADETPFFIKRCFNFFKFSTANVRKFGGGFITIAQNSSDVVVNGDTGILENSNSRFLFSIDGDKEAFRKRLRLSADATEKIEDLQKINGKLSEVLLADGVSEKVLRIRLAPKEYWSFTSSHSDRLTLKNLIESVPGLSEEEAIQCLSRV